MSETDGAPKWSELLGRDRLPQVVVLCLSIWLHAADTLLTATVMPTAVTEIGGVAYMHWTLLLYELASIVAGAATGLTVGRRGLRPTFIAALGIYAGGCLMSALAPNMAVMLLGRLLQGFGGGFMIALCHVAMAQLFPERLWPRLLALVSGTWGASALVGPLIGGLFAEAGWWRGAFWAFGLQAGLVAVAVWFLIGRDKRPGAAAAVDHGVSRFPYRRLLVLTAAILAVAFAGAEPRPLLAGGLVIAGLALLFFFLRQDSRAPEPLLPRRAFSAGHPMGLGLMTIVLLAIPTVSFTVYGPLLMAERFGAGPLAGGLMIALESVAWTFFAIAFASIHPRWESWVIFAGAVIVTLGVIGFTVVMPWGPLWSLVPPAFAMGGGFGMAFAYIVRRLVGHAPLGERERAAGAVPTIQMLGYALGSALVGIAANSAGLSLEMSPETLAAVSFWPFAVGVPLALAGCATAWRLARAGPAPEAAEGAAGE
jgi:MFS family permease